MKSVLFVIVLNTSAGWSGYVDNFDNVPVEDRARVCASTAESLNETSDYFMAHPFAVPQPQIIAWCE